MITSRPHANRALGAVALLLAAIATTPPATAELRILQHDDGRFSTILMTIVDHPDPVDVAAWQPFGPSSEAVLNPDGGVRGDGRPDIVVDPETGLPIVVWSYQTGGDRDVVVTTWSGEGWKPYETVAISAADELDPRAAIDDDGRLLVTWWTPDDGVWFAFGDPDADQPWSTPVRVGETNRGAARPSLLVHQGEVLVAYERLGQDGAGRELVVARQLADGSFERTIVAQSEGPGRLDPILHGAGGLLWVDWKHGAELFGHAVANGGDWTDWNVLVRSDRTWIDVEQARAAIRTELIAP